MEIKYEAVFGDQSLFDGCSKYAVLAISDMTPVASIVEFFEDDNLNFETFDVDSRRLKVAMRRIIKTPVWTHADNEAGRLREEWCDLALKIINHKFIDSRGPLAIYDALLSGDLPVPVKE